MTTAKIKVHAIYTDSKVNDQVVEQMLATANLIYMADNPTAPSVKFELSSSEPIFDSALIQDTPTSGVGLNFHLPRQARAARYPGKVVVIFRSAGGNQSSSWGDYLVLGEVLPGHPPLGFTFAHEVGHYLHLGHTFNGGITNELYEANRDKGFDAAKAIAIDYIRKSTKGLGVFDADDGNPDTPEGSGWAKVGDTPPDPGPPLFQSSGYGPNAPKDEACIGTGTLSLDVDGKPFMLTPDRTNVMSYFYGCKNTKRTVSPHQRRVIDRVLTSGNRRHLTKGASPEGPAAVVTKDGTIHVFARGDDRNIWRNVREGTVWNGWKGDHLGAGTLISGPAAVVTKDGTIHVFAQGLDRNIWHSYLTGKVSSGWFGGHMGAGTLTSAPTAVVTPAGAIHVFARGDDRNIWHNFSDGKTWNGWKADLGAGTVTSAPTAVVTPDEVIHVFARGDDRNIRHNFRNGKTWSGWKADLPKGTFMSGVATVISSDEALHAFALDDGRRIVHSVLNGQTWSAWDLELGGGTFQP
jgi:hypothetical protein